MIPLHPLPEASYQCPECGIALRVTGWHMPGMRMLADLRCGECGREYFGDLPAGHGLYYPMLISKETGVVHTQTSGIWFEAWLRNSYNQRTSDPVDVEAERQKPIAARSRRIRAFPDYYPVVLNCLDVRYGHSFLKLLNAQYYLDHLPHHPLIVIVPRWLRWMVPQGVSEIYTVDLPLNRGSEWNDWLAAKFHELISRFEKCDLSIGFCHPHPDDYDIERFVGQQPFPLQEWDERLARPTITFIWREDRIWIGNRCPKSDKRDGRTENQPVQAGLGADAARGANRNVQLQNVVELAAQLHKHFSNLDFGIVGLGEPGDFPPEIADLRCLTPDEHTEREWCTRFANSHVVVGVHGSNMLLPSGLAGGVVELMPDDRWGNIVETILPRDADNRESLFRYRTVPYDTNPNTLAIVIGSMLTELGLKKLLMERRFCDHRGIRNPLRWRNASIRHQRLTRNLSNRQEPSEETGAVKRIVAMSETETEAESETNTRDPTRTSRLRQRPGKR